MSTTEVNAPEDTLMLSVTILPFPKLNFSYHNVLLLKTLNEQEFLKSVI